MQKIRLEMLSMDSGWSEPGFLGIIDRMMSAICWGIDYDLRFFRAGTALKFFPLCLQKTDGFYKIHFFGNHHQINGVEIFLTGKASGQIGFQIYRRVKFPHTGQRNRKTPSVVRAGIFNTFSIRAEIGYDFSRCIAPVPKKALSCFRDLIKL